MTTTSDQYLGLSEEAGGTRAGSQDKLRIWVIHSAYQQRGGEDSVMEAEVALLREHGHQVETWVRHNDDVKNMSRLSLAAQTLWSSGTTGRVASFVREFRPDVIHVHNTLPLVSPSVFWAADRAGVPIVQTLHNFRLMCPQATFLRDGRVCEDCLGRALPWPAIQHRCYRDSAVQTAAVACTMSLHRAIGTWRQKVTRYIALNAFCRDKFVAGGLPPERIDIKPNFVDRMQSPVWHGRHGGLYVGRLSVEKGVPTLLEMMRLNPQHGVQVIGGGPLEDQVRAVAGAQWLGPQSLDEVMERLSRAAFLVLPSACYEGFPRTLVEAFACGVPVIASRHGSLAELVEHGRTGLLVDPSEPRALAQAVRWAQENPDAMLQMGRQAHETYLAQYTPERNLRQLESSYSKAISHRQSLLEDGGRHVH
jgi:glycosyltransferase involved in cell wall biosynthesis